MDSHNTGTKGTVQSPPSEESLPAQPNLLTSSKGSGSTAHAPLPAPHHTRARYLLNLFSMMAFSVHRSSAGRELACQRRRSSALDRYSVRAISVRN